MPKFLEQDLKAEAAKKGMTGKQADRYVYGAMNNMGAMHGNKTTPKGRAMQKKHAAKRPKPQPSQARGIMRQMMEE